MSKSLTNEIPIYRIERKTKFLPNLLTGLALAAGFAALLFGTNYLVQRAKERNQMRAAEAQQAVDSRVEDAPSDRALARVEMIYLYEFNAAGRNLTPDQDRKLAEIFTTLDNPRVNPEYFALRKSNIDPKTGLSDLDRQIMAQAKSILSPKQMEVLQRDLSARTSAKPPAKDKQHTKIQ